MTSNRGLDARVPETGRAADCYAVAETALTLSRRVTELAPGEGRATWNCARHACELHRISGALHRMAEHECNGTRSYSCRYCQGEGYAIEHGNARRECKSCKGTGDSFILRMYRADAEAIAAHYGLRCYFQPDPRGCALYLIDPAMLPDRMTEQLGDYVYQSDGIHVPPLAVLQDRWIASNYNRGHAVVRIGR